MDLPLQLELPAIQVPISPKIACSGHIPAVREVFNKPHLVDKIVTGVYRTSSIPEFVSCLQVCRGFYYASLPLLEWVMTLGELSLKSFVNWNRSRRVRVFLTEVLTVRLDAKETDISNPSGFLMNIDMTLRSLAEIIKHDMPFLKSFSFHVGDQLLEGRDLSSDTIRSRPAFMAASVMSLLDALPRGCKYLELDTSGLECYREYEHICPHFSRLMPSLHHARVRIGRICAVLFGVERATQVSYNGYPEDTQPPFAPFLRSLVINTELSPSLNGRTCSCTQSPSTPGKPEFLIEDSTEALFLCYTEKNFFPVLERLDVYLPLHVSLAGVGAIQQADIRYNRSHIQSFVPLPAREPDAPRPISWRCIRSKNKGDIIAPFAWARELLEDSWRSTTAGARFPICPGSGDIPAEFSRFKPEWEANRYNRDVSTYIRRQKKRRAQNDIGSILLRQTDVDLLLCATYNGIMPATEDKLPEPLRPIRGSIE